VFLFGQGGHVGGGVRFADVLVGHEVIVSETGRGESSRWTLVALFLRGRV
jgi:hypothetical protein